MNIEKITEKILVGVILVRGGHGPVWSGFLKTRTGPEKFRFYNFGTGPD